MRFHSILFRRPDEPAPQQNCEAPSFFRDLNLDQIVEGITANWKDYDLKPFFFTRLNELDAIAYRQEVMQDLEDGSLLQAVISFSAQMRAMRERLDQGKKLDYYQYAMQRRFLEAVEIYCEAVERLLQEFPEIKLKSRGLNWFRAYLAEYVASESFRNLVSELDKVRSDLSTITYSLVLKDGSLTVRHYLEEDDYTAAVEETFEKFRRDAPSHHRLEIRRWEEMNHIDGQVQDRVALLYPEIFGALDAFCTSHADYLDETIARFDREVQFYVACLKHVEHFRRQGLSFCYPQLSQTSKEVIGREAFDLALAGKLLGEKAVPVTNDFFLRGAERVFVVSGSESGWQDNLCSHDRPVASSGMPWLPVPGSESRLFVFDRLFTHFERELDEATPNSLIVMNEMFSSTTIKDAVYLSKEVMSRISALDLLCVWVTFLDELASFNEKTVSIVSTVNPENPAIRTFKLERKPADGLAYALAIAQKYRVTYHWLKERIKA